MILKEADDRSNDIAELKRLKKAAPASYHSAIQKRIDNIYSGLEGERGAAHFINREFGSNGNLAILHDLRIGRDGDYAQLDRLVIHRVQGTAWVLETKNYSGRLSCDEHGDWTVWQNGTPRSVQSPINQARRHCETLRLWLQANDVEAIKQIKPVVLISPTSSVNRKNIPQGTYVVKSDNFGEWWRKQADELGLSTVLGMLGRHLIGGMSRDELKCLGERLAGAHVRPVYDWRAMLRLPITGQAKDASKRDAAIAQPHVARGILSDTSQKIVSTLHGNIKISRLPDGRLALSNDNNDALIETVRKACKGKARWNTRFKNWIVSDETLPEILAAIDRSHAP